MLRRWTRLTLEHPRAAVGLCLALSVVWLPFLFRLRLATDGRALFSPHHPALLFQQQVDEQYASSDFLVIGLQAGSRRELFAPAPLNAVLRLSQELAALPGVESVRSLADDFSPEWIDGALHLAPPVQETVRDARQAAEVRRAAEREPTFRGVLLSADRRSTALYVALRPGADRRQLYHRIEGLLDERRRSDPDLARSYRFHLLGSAAAESLLGEHVLNDLILLLPLALLVVAATLWFWFRQGSIVAVGLGEGSIAVLWTLGLMAALDRPISLVTVVMPVILVIYCVGDTIHLAQHFSARRPLSAAAERLEAMDRTLDEVLSPVISTALTTAAGFLAFAGCPIPPLRDFGLFSAFGVLVSLVVSVFVVPAALLASGFGRHRTAAGVEESPRFGRQLSGLGAAAARAPWRVVLLLLLLTVLAGLGSLRLEIQDSWIHNFSSRSPLVRSDAWFNRGFYGSNVLNVILTPRGGTVHSPAFLAELRRLQQDLARRNEVGGSLSVADSLQAVSRSLEGAPRLPRNRRESEGWALLYRVAGGGESLDAYLNARESATNLWVFLNQGDYRRTAAVLAEVSRFRWNGPPPAIRFAGDAYLGHQLVDSIARSQRNSALAALAMTFVIVWWILRSLETATLAVLPVALSVAWNFGLMGWIGLPLGIATSTFCAIAFGMGIDFALHWIARLRLGLERGMSWLDAVRFTGMTTGGSLLVQGFVLTLGFAVLLLSTVPPNRYLSFVLGINLVTCLGASLVLLPAVATLMMRRRLVRRAATARLESSPEIAA